MMQDTEHLNDEIDMEACLWVTKIDGGNMSDADYRDLKAWLLADQKHKTAFETYVSDFLVVDDILSTVSEAIYELEEKGGLIPKRIDQPKPPRPRIGWSIFGASLAVACVAVVAVIAIGLPMSNVSDGAIETHFVSHNGGQKTLTLADGSSLVMNTDSQIRVAFTSTERRIELDQGEAVFDVVKDPNRPFIVNSGETSVRAIGTVFSVRALDDGVEVLVEEGVVELIAPAAVEIGAVASTPGQSVIRLNEGELSRVSLTDGILQRNEGVSYVERRLSWRDGVLSFDEDILTDVVMEFNRYSDREIVIVDAELAELKIGGVFPIERTDAFLDALETGFDVNVERTTSGAIEISKLN